MFKILQEFERIPLMKRIFTIAALTLLTLSFMPATCYAMEKTVTDIPYMTPVIDGRIGIGEYPASSVFTLDSSVLNTLPESAVTGSFDRATMGLDICMTYDSDNLYIAAKIKDTDQLPVNGLLEFGQDLKPDRFTLNLFSDIEDYFSFTFSFNSSENNSDSLVVCSRDLVTGEYSDISSSVTGKVGRNNRTVTFEAAIPWKHFSDNPRFRFYPEASGMLIPYSVSYEDYRFEDSRGLACRYSSIETDPGPEADVKLSAKLGKVPEPATEPATEPVTEPPEVPVEEPATEPHEEIPTQPPTVPATEAPTQRPTEKPTEPKTEPPTKPVIAPTEPATVPATETVTDPPTDIPTDPRTEPYTDPEIPMPTEKPSAAQTGLSRKAKGIIAFIAAFVIVLITLTVSAVRRNRNK